MVEFYNISDNFVNKYDWSDNVILMNPGTAVICAVALAALAVIAATYCAVQAYPKSVQSNAEPPIASLPPKVVNHSHAEPPIASLPPEVLALIFCFSHNPTVNLVCRKFNNANKCFYGKKQLERLNSFKKNYALPDKGKKESDYSYLGKCVRAISKEQRRIIGLPVFKETNLFKALQLIEECEEKIPDPIFNQFCRAIQIDKFYLPGAVIDHRLLTRPSSDLSCKNLSK